MHTAAIRNLDAKYRNPLFIQIYPLEVIRRLAAYWRPVYGSRSGFSASSPLQSLEG